VEKTIGRGWPARDPGWGLQPRMMWLRGIVIPWCFTCGPDLLTASPAAMITAQAAPMR